MKAKNPFDIRLESPGTPPDVRVAAIFVTDTLDLCWASAQAVFEDKATPELALAIYDRLRIRIGEGPREETNGR